MKIFFEYDKKQVIKALRLHFIGRNEVRILVILVNVFAIFSAAMFYLHKVSPLAFLVSSMLWIAIMVACWFVLPNSVYKKTTTFKDSFIMTFGEHIIHLENSQGVMEWPWSRLTNYVESPLFFHLYFDSKSFFLVPKKAVENTGDLSEMRQLLKNKVIKTTE